MPLPTNIMYELDITGKNVNNLIRDEPHLLSNRPTRSIAPKLGVFFAEGLIVKDGVKELSRGIDYQLVELHQEATLLYGKELNSVILIINKEVSSNVTITYQVLGGHYINSDDAIARLFESLLTDNRPVDWSNIFNKPTEYNPLVHRHLLDDVFGFEPVVDHLERIKRAITLGQSNILLEVVNSLLSKFKCGELPKVLPSNKLIQYDAMLYFLSRRKILNNIWVDKKVCKWVKGTSSIIQVDTSGYPVGTKLYWELYKPDGNISLFTRKTGEFFTTGGIDEFSMYIPAEDNLDEGSIYLGIKENPTDTDFKAVTYTLDIAEHVKTPCGFGHMLLNYDELGDFDRLLSITDSNDEMRLYQQITRR